MDKENHKTQKETGTPVVSILVPVYNVENYLHPCLDSIMAQTFTDFEAILVDDGSTDNSGKICDEYAAKDKRFIVVHKQNEGVAKARITAFEHSKGEYITFIDADDFIDLRYLDIMMNIATRYQVDMVGCRYYCYREKKVIKTVSRITGYYDRTSLEKIIQTQFIYDRNTGAAGIPLMLCTKAVRREYVLDGLRLSEGMKWYEDTTALIHILIHIQSFYEIDDSLYYYVMHLEQATDNYCTESLDNLFEAYRRLQQLDVNCLLKNQLHLLIWLFGIKKFIFNIMPRVIHNYATFLREMNQMKKHPSWKSLFSKQTMGIDWKNDLQYWLLKLEMFRLFYFLYYQRALNRQKKS